jgi:uncharacterized protein with HEPN domain
MFDEKNLLYLLTILECIEKISIYAKNIQSPQELLDANDQMNFNASNNLLIAIGEESKKIDSNLKSKFPEFPWSEVAGLRDKLAHDYRGVDPEIIFTVIKDYLDKLKEVIISMISLINPNREVLNELLNNDYYKHIRYLIHK